uniref:Variant surface glycoprotein 1125.426 n=1 Tax=Trypanosoma brucei TaxID=5691 RepID=A0A1J0R4B0_9TRYP|nr:variant surface glycoprotein 1125.426 [Trypanosoma brucei]
MTLTNFGSHALVTLALLTATATTDDASSSDLTEACHVQKYLIAMDRHLENLENSLQNKPEELAQRARRYRIAASASGDAQTACLLQAIAADADTESATTQKAYDGALRKVREGRNFLKTLIRTAAETAALEKVSYKMPADNGKSIDTNKLAIRLEVKAISTIDCVKEEDDGGYKVEAKALKPLTIAKIKTADGGSLNAAIAKPAIQLTTGGGCTNADQNWKAYDTAAANCGGDAATAHRPALHEDPTSNGKRPKISEISIYVGDDPAGGCRPADQITGVTDNSMKQKFAALCQALKTAKPSQSGTKLEGKALSQKPIIQQVIQGCLPEYMNKEKLNTEETETLRKFLEAAYTDSEANFAKKFEHLVDKQKVQVYKDGKVQSVEIGSITTPAEEHDALSRISANKRAEKLASRKETATPDQKESGDKTEEKKDGDNKTSEHTTASNSFVIKTSPLLLALLLF